jgi:hypothetical protein
MKFLARIVLLVAFISTSAFGANLEQREDAKRQLTKIHNVFSSMDSAEYVRTLDLLAKNASEQGMDAEARLFESLKQDPASQFEITNQLREKLDSASENGIYLVIYLMYPVGWCYVGDIACGFSVAFLSIITLEGEQASDL